eukprot:7448293-Pyramimonas_sp.AAC.1
MREATSYDEYDGWADLSQLLNTWPAEGYEHHRHTHLDTVRRLPKNRHWAYQAYAVLELIGMVDESGMKQTRLHMKKMSYSDTTCDASFARPTDIA